MASLSHNFDYHENIRAKIIANNSKTIKNIDGVRRLMQFNDWYIKLNRKFYKIEKGQTKLSFFFTFLFFA